MEKISQIIPANVRNSPIAIYDERNVRAGAPDFIRSRAIEPDRFSEATRTQFSPQAQEQANRLRSLHEGIDRLTRQFFLTQSLISKADPANSDVAVLQREGANLPQVETSPVDYAADIARTSQDIPNRFMRIG